MIKKYLYSYVYLIGIMLLLIIILSVCNYYLIINGNTFKIFIPIIGILISAIILGKNTKEKAYIEGIKFASGYIIISVIMKIILKTGWNYKVFISYFLIVFTSIIGSMIGINIKNK